MFDSCDEATVTLDDLAVREAARLLRIVNLTADERKHNGGGAGRPGRPVRTDRGERFASSAEAVRALEVEAGRRMHRTVVTQAIRKRLRVLGRRWFYGKRRGDEKS